MKSKIPIPPIIRRNTILLTVSRGLLSVGFIVIPVVSPLIMLRFTGSIALAGLTRGVPEACRMVMAYPAGKIMDRRGRKVGLFIGWGLLTSGGLVVFLSVVNSSLLIFMLGMVLLGLGLGPLHLTQLAAADMYPPERKAEGVSIALTGAIVGGLAGPVVMAAAVSYGTGLGLDPYALPWLAIPLLGVGAAIFIAAIHPDPRDIALKLEEYYPHLQPFRDEEPNDVQPRGFAMLVRDYPILASFTASALTFGNMVMMMSLFSVVMDHHGYGLTAISISIAIHSLGMFAFSMPLGKLADRFGRKRLLLTGILVSGLSCLASTLTPDYLLTTLSIFLVGVGWSAATVAATAVIADVTHPLERGKALGGNDLVSGILNVSFPVVGGWFMDTIGMVYLGLFALVVSFPALAVVSMLREVRPGEYLHPSHLIVGGGQSARPFRH